MKKDMKTLLKETQRVEMDRTQAVSEVQKLREEIRRTQILADEEKWTDISRSYHWKNYNKERGEKG